MIRFLVDEDFNNDILRGLRRRVPDIDAPRIQGLGLAGVSDETVLAYAASENRVVLTHDVSSLVASAYRRVEAAEPMPGVIAVVGAQRRLGLYAADHWGFNELGGRDVASGSGRAGKRVASSNTS